MAACKSQVASIERAMLCLCVALAIGSATVSAYQWTPASSITFQTLEASGYFGSILTSCVNNATVYSTVSTNCGKDAFGRASRCNRVLLFGYDTISRSYSLLQSIDPVTKGERNSNFGSALAVSPNSEILAVTSTNNIYLYTPSSQGWALAQTIEVSGWSASPVVHVTDTRVYLTTGSSSSISIYEKNAFGTFASVGSVSPDTTTVSYFVSPEPDSVRLTVGCATHCVINTGDELGRAVAGGDGRLFRAGLRRADARHGSFQHQVHRPAQMDRRGQLLSSALLDWSQPVGWFWQGFSVGQYGYDIAVAFPTVAVSLYTETGSGVGSTAIR